MNNSSSPYSCPNSSSVPCKQYTAYGGSAQSNQYNNRYANGEYAQNQYNNNQYVNNGYNQNQYSSQYVNNEFNQNQYNSQYMNNGYNQAPCNSQYMNNGYNQSQCSNNRHNCSQYFGGQSANNQYSAAAVGAAPQPMQLNRSIQIPLPAQRQNIKSKWWLSSERACVKPLTEWAAVCCCL